MNNIKNDDIANPIEVWISDAAGVGKSAKIKFEAEKLNLKYLYFPIGGSFTRREIINRIKKLEIEIDNFLYRKRKGSLSNFMLSRKTIWIFSGFNLNK